MSSLMTPTYQSGFAAPQRGRMKYPSLWRGCVGAWNPGLGPTGLVLRDWSGKQNHGSVGINAVFDVRQGYVLTCQFLASSQKAVSVEDSASLRFSNHSFSAFIRPTATQGFLPIASKATNIIAGGFEFGVSGAASNKLAMFYYDGGLRGAYLANTTLSTEVRYHVGYVYSPSKSKLDFYLNGKPDGSVAITGTPFIQDSSPFLIGNQVQQAKAFGGDISDVVLWNTEIAASQFSLLSTRPGIAYELAPRKVYSIPAAVGTYKPYLQNYRSQIIGGGLK